jgi:tRNA dimethylallyltransferase
MERILYGLKSTPPPNQEKRIKYMRWEERLGKGFLHGVLTLFDEGMSAKVHPNNLSRIIRYLERTDNGGCADGIDPLESDHVLYFLYRNITEIHMRIQNRVDRMFELGWEDEVRSLIKKGFQYDDPGMDSTGYSRMIEFVSGNISEIQCKELIIKDTLSLVKYQMKWKNRLPNAISIDIGSMTTIETVDLILDQLHVE